MKWFENNNLLDENTPRSLQQLITISNLNIIHYKINIYVINYSRLKLCGDVHSNNIVLDRVLVVNCVWTIWTVMWSVASLEAIMVKTNY